MDDIMKKAADLVIKASNIVAFTGAGASTESNIPDFRSAGGAFESIKSKYGYPPEVLLSYSFFNRKPEIFYDYYKSSMIFSAAEPNNCHIALAELEEAGKLKAVVTQNVDGLHQKAGSKQVFELHGSTSRNYCVNCRRSYDAAQMMALPGIVPRCTACNGIVRPDVVLYEESLDQNVIEGAVNAISAAEVLIVIGSSLVVYPAAGLLNYYKGNKLILINRDTTPFDNKADIVINSSAGSVMKYIVSRMQV